MLKTRAGEIIGTHVSAAAPVYEHSPRAPPSSIFLRFADLVERGIVRNRQTLKNWIENYGFPPGRWLSPNARAWTEAEVAAWLDSRPGAESLNEGE